MADLIIETVEPLITLAGLKSVLGIVASDGVNEEQLAAMITGASAAIRREMPDVDLSPRATTGELYDGLGTGSLELRRRPVKSVEAVWIGWRQASESGEALDLGEVVVYPDHIELPSDGEYLPRLRGGARVFPEGRQNVRVDYTAGYAEIPFDLSFACAQQVQFLQNTVLKAGLVSETNSVANSATMYAQTSLCPAAMRTVNRYRAAKVAVV